MRQFSADELARMQATAQASMMDKCDLLMKVEVGKDEFNQPKRKYEIALVTPCGFMPVSAVEVKGQTQVPLIDAQIRLPISLHGEFDNCDRVQITHRYGVELATPVTYEFVGQPQRGPSALVVDLKLVTDGSI